MSTEGKNTLGKAEKLKSHKQIEALFGSGRSFFVHPVKVFYQFGDVFNEALAKPNDGEKNSPHVQIGVSASKRNFKKAVDRNRVKRLLREAYRLNKHDLLVAAEQRHAQLHVFFIYVDKTLPTFTLIEEKMKACLKRLVKMVEDAK